MAKFNPSSKEGYLGFTRMDEKVLGLILWTVNFLLRLKLKISVSKRSIKD